MGGSAVLGDFTPGISDLNFVAVIAPGVRRSTWSAIDEAHRLLLALDPSCPLDGIYIDADELAAATAVTSGPCVRAGTFALSGAHGRDALRWHAIEGCGEVLRGDGSLPSVPRWLRGSDLDAAVLEAAGRVSSSTDESATVRNRQAFASQVLEVTRLHYTLATSRFCSKAKAGLYGLVTFGSSEAVIEAALRARRNPLAQTFPPSEDVVTAFVRMVLADLAEVASGT